MAKPLRRLSGDELKAAINRRLAENTGGLGYLSAVDAAHKLSIPMPEKRGKRKTERETERKGGK
jgi:hypothetical protein